MQYTAAQLQEELAHRSGRRIHLVLTNNRRRMISAKVRVDGAVELRLQHIFLHSPSSVLDEIGHLLQGKKTSRAAIRAFIEGQLEERCDVAQSGSRSPNPATQKSVNHDIHDYAARLNRLYLQGRSTAEVRWGRSSTRRSSRSIRFACYDPVRNVIIMNRKMDNPQIPDYFVEYVLFHEMLHEVLGIDTDQNGRRAIHTPLFKLMESTYPDYQKALTFEKQLCSRLGSLL